MSNANLSPAQKEQLADVDHAFEEVKTSLQELEPRETFERELAMNHLVAAQSWFRNSVIQSNTQHKRRELIIEALQTDGGHHKQYYLMELAKLEELNLAEYDFDFGIAP